MNWANATHVVHYSHCIGQNCRNYAVRCHILKKMPDGKRLKIKTFGNMWKGSEEISRIRYVESFRVTAL